MLQNEIIKLKEIYESILETPIDEKEFLKGNLIEKFNIDSLIALQIIVKIEKSFCIIIEDDEVAIKIVDSPFFFCEYISKG